MYEKADEEDVEAAAAGIVTSVVCMYGWVDAAAASEPGDGSACALDEDAEVGNSNEDDAASLLP